jgi:tRNA-2-methylthio-N6-dimethylallyladenosine synthase
VSEEAKRRRNVELLKVQERISLANNQALVGTEVEILVEGYSKAAQKLRSREDRSPATIAPGRLELPMLGSDLPRPGQSQLVGRTRGDQIVVYEGPESDIGQLKRLRITAASALTLHAVA